MKKVFMIIAIAAILVGCKGKYEVTTYCPFNVKLFSKIMSLLEKNENGEFWFNIDKK